MTKLVEKVQHINWIVMLFFFLVIYIDFDSKHFVIKTRYRLMIAVQDAGFHFVFSIPNAAVFKPWTPLWLKPVRNLTVNNKHI